jgi:argininosuccinate lyase
MSSSKKLWGGRFTDSSAEITERLSASIDYDRRLYAQDIAGSKAHAKMMNSINVLTDGELSDILTGLDEIKKEIDQGIFTFSSDLEDIHMNIESQLTKRIGDAGKKLHTGRSRNDQVALDERLFILDSAREVRNLLLNLMESLVIQAEKNIDTLIPGYTHLQVAQPVRFAHHLLAYAWQFSRDIKRLDFSISSADSLPLGAGAMSGVNYPSNREMVREELGFSSIIINSMDAVSDRDFILDFLYFSSVCALHLSRLSEELVLWSTSEFSYIRLHDSHTTGSSIMPQKRNPDLAELIRGKTGRVYGNLVTLLTILKGLPMTYNRDLQEDKEPLFDSLDTISLSLQGMTAMISEMTVNSDVMKQGVYSNFSTATDLADYLVKKGVPFRQSHEIVGSVVKFCEDEKKDFFALTFDDLKSFSTLIEEDVVSVISPEGSTERKESPGSTSRKEVEKQLALLKKEWLS